MHRLEHEVLLRRAKQFLEEANTALNMGRFDIACFLAEQAAQLCLKAQLLKTCGDYPRTHYIRQLLSELANSIKDEKLRRQIEDFTRRNRVKLSALEDAYTMARYTSKTYTREDAQDFIEAAREVIEFVERILGGV